MLDDVARVGRAVSNQHTASRRRVEAALAGHLPMTDLTLEEGVVFNAEISAAIEERLSRTNYGDVLAAQGITTVALNDAGPVVELLLGRTALTSTLGRRAVHQIRGDARDAVDGFGHDISPRV